VFSTGNDRLLHVTVFDSNNPSDALALFNESGSAVETAMRHTTLLSTIKNNSNSVAFFILVHDAANVQAASLVLSSSQDASSSYTLSLGSLHIGRLLLSESA
jgi:hypothetical protein